MARRKQIASTTLRGRKVLVDARGGEARGRGLAYGPEGTSSKKMKSSLAPCAPETSEPRCFRTRARRDGLEGLGGLGGEARPTNRNALLGKRFPASQKIWLPRGLHRGSQVMRSSFLYLAIITPSPAQGSLRSILCLSPAAIDLLKKKRARSPREGTRDHQGSLKSATNKVSLGLSPTSPSPTEYARPNKAPKGLGRGNTGAQNFARSVTSRGGRDAIRIGR